MRDRPAAGQIPVFLLTGFLGAGKTTLLNRLLDDPGLQDTALIINEFGLVPVDHDLVREGHERPVVTTTGCICCAAGSDLRASLDALLTARRQGSLPPFSRVIVETTGLADPAPIINSLIPGGLPALALRDHAVARAFRLSGVITVVNVAAIASALDHHPESLRQIAFADHVVLTHTDIRPAGDWPDRLRAINGALRLHDGAELDPAALLAPGSYSALGKGEGVGDWLAAEAQAQAHGGHGGHGGAFHNLNRHGNVLAVPLVRDDPVDEAALRQFLIRLTATPGLGLLRIKGLVALCDDASSPALVHAVQHRLYPILRLEGWPNGVAGSRLVIIGTHLDENAIRRDFDALAAPFAVPASAAPVRR